MDGITITIDASTMGILIIILYKVVQLEMRIKRIEDKLIRLEERDNR